MTHMYYDIDKDRIFNPEGLNFLLTRGNLALKVKTL